MIDLLKKIGLSDLEARCYLTLHEESNLSGYEVAKRVSVSRTNVYAALWSLTDKGACRSIEGETALYNAVPIEQLIRLFQVEFEKTSKDLINQLKTPPKPTPAFYNWQGGNALDKAVRRIIVNAETSIVVDVWSEDLHHIEEALLVAEKKGVSVILITMGACKTSLKHVFQHYRGEEWPAEERKFSILCDSSLALIGSFEGEMKPSALETNHPSVIEVIKNAFYHDMMMQHIEEDFGKEFQEKYGENYRKMLSYFKEKGLHV
ncbi:MULTISPECIES: TrmB family transcriptional regulator [Bacillus cereus group]|uniref:TrmB family transcriptional regulator n=1 Tax=Bacillus cereus TaxID=1396 RepID=A0AA44TFL4_BACCE|nr:MULTISPECIES: TrmB family transcriptional regulator [Bacillus cereus group]EEL49938.1 Transcriptional regulator TrmB [Bacillus cereus Rock3-44]PFA22473.1 TrmB family transcriptional regulator [Bacillus cereus]PFN05266.1 TrmB family transcriptional regulator [Bacillus cereus]PFO84624.1 TrmB family transcriptional regulator [Bacillus cereus]PFR26629.1 TrmB family transcriptional regulator [Bacillus cereus]